MAETKLPDGWRRVVLDDEVIWWNGDSQRVSAYPFVPGFFVVLVAEGIGSEEDNSTVPISAPFTDLLSAIAAARLML